MCSLCQQYLLERLFSPLKWCLVGHELAAYVRVSSRVLPFDLDACLRVIGMPL